MTSDKRARQLRKLRERRAAKRGPVTREANMRFGCRTCGLVFEHPANISIGNLAIVNESTGERTEIPIGDVPWQSRCPRCHQMAPATNQVKVTDADASYVGFADSPEQVAAIRASIAELRAMPADASVEEVATALERAGDHLRPLAQWLRDNHQLIGLGANLVAVAIALLAWIFPLGQGDEPRPVPDGITYDQMERLVEELQQEIATREQPAQRGDHTGHRHDSDTLGTEKQSRKERDQAGE
jgi:hypothetical protein